MSYLQTDRQTDGQSGSWRSSAPEKGKETEQLEKKKWEEIEEQKKQDKKLYKL